MLNERVTHKLPLYHIPKSESSSLFFILQIPPSFFFQKYLNRLFLDLAQDEEASLSLEFLYSGGEEKGELWN